jgi:hypothetical protein
LSNIILNKCHFIDANKSFTCDDWVFDKTYYESTLTEEVIILFNFVLIDFYIRILFNKKWSMVCEKAVRRGTLQTIYFSGYLVGSLVLGILADK